MHKTLSRGKRLIRGGNNERTPLLADGGGPTLDRSTATAASGQNSQLMPAPEAVLPDFDGVSSGGESIYGHRYDTFVNKSTTSSMINYADFRSDTSWQQANKPDLSRSVSLKGYDSCGDELERSGCDTEQKEGELTQTFEETAADEVLGKNGHESEAPQHFASPETDIGPDSSHSRFVDRRAKNLLDSSLEQPSAARQELHDDSEREHARSGESLEVGYGSSNISEKHFAETDDHSLSSEVTGIAQENITHDSYDNNPVV